MTAVTRIEATLAELEAIIDRGKQTFVEVGNALTEIRERKLYRESGYGTFEDYCQRRHGFSASRGRQLIAAAATVTAVTLSGGTPPATEREARALAAAQRAYDQEVTGEITDRSVHLPDEYDGARALVVDIAAKVGFGDENGIEKAVEAAILKVAARELVRTGSTPLPPPWWEWTYKSKYPPNRDATLRARNRLAIWEVNVACQAGAFMTWCEQAGISFPRKGMPVFAEHLHYPCEPGSAEARVMARLIAERGEDVEHTATIGAFHCFMLRPDELTALKAEAAS